jgi:gliding motility-associated-like protein
MAAIPLSAQVAARFSGNITKGCAPLVIHFTDESAGNPIAWKWDLGNGTVSYFQHPSATYFNPGIYSVKLVVRNASGADSLTKVHYITVFASPVIDFNASDTGGCYPLKIQFTDKTNSIDASLQRWLWDFGDGNTDSVQHPQHTYLDIGNYNVSLQVKNSNGCVSSLTKPNYIQLKSGIHAAFAFSLAAQCKPPTNILFTNATNGTGLLTYEWDFGDGEKSALYQPIHTYRIAGTYTVKLIARNNSGCVDSVVKHQAIVIGAVSADFTYPSVICAGQPIQLINRSQPNATGATWKFGDSTISTEMNPIKSYSAGGNYTISLVSDFGACKDSASHAIAVVEKPIADFNGQNTHACQAPLITSFHSNAVGAVSYKWFFGDGDSTSNQNPTHTYKTTGDFDVMLVVTNIAGCTDTLRRKSFVRVQPPKAAVANIPVEGCEPFSFMPSPIISSVDSIVKYEWDFGDGKLVEGINPVHPYSAGTYYVKLIITSSGGCTDTVIALDAIRIGTRPNPSFSAVPRYSCAFQPISFSDLSVGGADHWLWRFGDGGISTDQHPSHIYQDTGYFHPTLIVTNNGCKDSIRVQDYVYIKAPIAKFVDSSACDARFERKFIDKSIGATDWYWDFGDGNFSSERNPVHKFSSPGKYTVKLTVKNDTCEHTTASEIIIMVEKAEFNSTDTITCKGAPINFSATEIQPANIASHLWDFGDGVIQYGPADLSHVYSSAGKFDVRLLITDINGCVDSLVKPMYIQVNGPTANFINSLPGACIRQEIVFADASVPDSLHPIKSWIWSYGDGKSDSVFSPPFHHVYETGGNYTVTLKVRDAQGCADSIARRNSIIISRPVSDFISADTNSCVRKTIRFSSLSTGPALNYYWDFGDGQTSTITNPVHAYQHEGAYSVSLKIIDQYGCADSLGKNAYVNIKDPVAQFSISDSVSTCPPLVVNFSNQSNHFVGYEWDFGDGTGSALQNPVHFFSYPGTYHARLKVVSPGGCIDSLMKTIVVRGPQGSFTYDRFSGCVPTTVNFVASTKDRVSFVWDFNDGETIASGDSLVSHTYDMMGEYLPKMILRDPQGCQVPVIGKDTIRVYGVNAGFTTNTEIICDSGVVNFTSSSISNDLIIKYDWIFGDGSRDLKKDPSHWFSKSGNYPIHLVVSTFHQCVDSATNVLPLKVSVTPRSRILGDTAACVRSSLKFDAQILKSDTSHLQWKWNFGNNTSSAVQHPDSVAFSAAGDYHVRLILSNSSACADTANFPVIIHQLPMIDAGADAVICKTEEKRLQANGGVKFNWLPASSLSCSSCASPIARPDSTVRYVVTGENGFGCRAMDSVLITVKQPFKIKTSKGDTLCKGESYQLEVSGADQYLWSPLSGLDDFASSHPKVRPDSTITYRVIGKDNEGCFADTSFVRMVVYPYPLVEAGADKTIMGGNSIDLNPVISADVKSIRWTPEKWLSCYNCASPVAMPKQTTKYSIKVSNEGGCVATSDLNIFVLCEAGNLFVPNTFSPNGDGINDVFYPRGKGIYSIRNLRVFNRWGEVVFGQSNFQANDISKGWNGTINGKLASQDVYVYTIDVICENNVVFSYKGNVALIR